MFYVKGIYGICYLGTTYAKRLRLMPEPNNSDVSFETYHTSLPTVEPTKLSAMLPLSEFLEDFHVSL